MLSNHIDQALNHLCLVHHVYWAFHNFIQSKIFINPNSDLAYFIDSYHFISDEEGLFGMEN